MFHSREKPLYELCEQMTLDKIPAEIYAHYFNHVSKHTWNEKLSTEVIDRILALTQRHPRRVYNLCFYLWRLNDGKKRSPNEKSVDEAWDYFVAGRVKNTRDALSSLSKGQIKILTYIALGHHEELSGQIAQRLLNLASSSITRQLKVLEELDYVEVKNNYASIIDPLIQEVLRKYENGILAA